LETRYGWVVHPGIGCASLKPQELDLQIFIAYATASWYLMEARIGGHHIEHRNRGTLR
jgi:hypothetical protein